MRTHLWVKWLLILLGGGLLVIPASLWLPSSSNSQTPGDLLVCPQGCSFTSIQAAIEAAPSGSTVRVLAGSYQENLKITKEIRLIGESADRVTLRGVLEKEARRAPSRQVPLIRVEDAVNVLIEGLTLQGDKDLGNYGIEIRNGAAATIRNNAIEDFINGVSLDDIFTGPPPRALVLDNVFRANGDGIDILGGQAVIEGNHLEDNTGGIVVSGGICCDIAVSTVQAYISANTIAGGVEGITIQGFVQASLVRNRISGTKFTGVEIRNIPMNQVFMYQNEVVDNQGWGMALSYTYLCQSLEISYSIGGAASVALMGRENEIRDNQAADVCPPDWPLPRDFLK